jgi:hypothetical protein
MDKSKTLVEALNTLKELGYEMKRNLNEGTILLTKVRRWDEKSQRSEEEAALKSALRSGYGLDDAERRMDLPVYEAVRIQEVLRPLGYAVCGYHAGSVVTVELLPGRTLPYRESPDYPGGIAGVGMNEPDNSLAGKSCGTLSMDGVSGNF